MVHSPWFIVRSRLWRPRNRVIRHENLLAGETERGILLRAALAVGDQRVELIQESIQRSPPSPYPLHAARRAQPPANDRSLADMHPPDRGRSRKTARVRFDNQDIRVPFIEP